MIAKPFRSSVPYLHRTEGCRKKTLLDPPAKITVVDTRILKLPYFPRLQVLEVMQLNIRRSETGFGRVLE